MSTPTKGLRLRVAIASWSGHGEGGWTCTVRLNRDYGDLYDSSEEQQKQAQIDALFINNLIADYESKAL